MDKDHETKQRIIEAAFRIFATKGKEGARIQEIADLAKANKAMIYYYYTSKENLYEVVLNSVLEMVFEEMANLALKDLSPEEKVKNLIDAYVIFFIHHPYLSQLLLREIIDGGELLRKIVARYRDVFKSEPEILPANVIQQGIDAGVFRSLDPTHTFMSLMGMVIVYALARPVVDTMLGIEESQMESFIEERRKQIADLILNGLLVK